MSSTFEVRPLAAMRIALGCVMLANLASRSVGFHESMAALTSVRGGTLGLGQSALADGTFVVLSALVHMAWILGIRPLSTGALTALGWLMQLTACPELHTFAEHLQLYACIIIAMSGSASGVLTRGEQGHWHLAYGAGARWFHVLVQLQLVLLYAQTGWAKTAASWFDGNALVFVYSNPWFSNVTSLGEVFAIIPTASTLAGIAVVLWERMFPLVILAEWTGMSTSSRHGLAVRRIFLGFGIALHCAILLTMKVGFFSPITMCLYLSFLDPRALVIPFLRPLSLHSSLHGPTSS